MGHAIHLILGIHLIEFINTADTIVSQHESTGFDTKLPRLTILHHRCRQT